ncbi:FAD-dependent oxidoreductase [Stieleria sp. TO1_6]|uniref:NAD(P)/FAD-dependent oxidoreductase n=1 Tax=Stieleria tagensis TaxID=2956795 RepID=UPI00209B429D|nr:FAD-dependent oxidoreductase [Stieleria tagensis]MCO8122050.1 FAD-dependent oxidoreductase [Stieleria tagensis]
MESSLKIAVIGSGISGLVCARLLAARHDLTLFESDQRLGGHANTVTVRDGETQHQIDTGFIVYNDRTYPQFSRILADLGVDTMPTSMSFSVRCDRTGLEYNGTSLNGLFAQRQNLLRPKFLKLLSEILRFNRRGADDWDRVPAGQTVAEYLRQGNYSQQFCDHYLLPMGAAIWSCPRAEFASFPIRFILEFYLNHGLLSVTDRPVWRSIVGGSQSYVQRLATPFRDRIRTACPVHAVSRLDQQVLVRHAQGVDQFDEVVFACHSDQALRILEDTDALEQELLGAFPYSLNSAVLHTDESVLPRRRRAWASWNYCLADQPEIRPAVTYNMNLLQGIRSANTYCVTLNQDDRIDPARVLAKFQYAHPVFTTRRAAIQSRHDEVIRRRRTSFCGAYWRNGFHEDGVVSALAVCRKFGVRQWNAGPGDDDSVTAVARQFVSEAC